MNDRTTGSASTAPAGTPATMVDCRMLMTFAYAPGNAYHDRTSAQRESVANAVTREILGRIPETAIRTWDVVPMPLDENGDLTDETVRACVLEVLGRDAPMGGPFGLQPAVVAYNLHDEVRCCAQRFGMLRQGAPWLVQHRGVETQVQVQLSFERPLQDSDRP